MSTATAQVFLAAAGLAGCFDTVVDGRIALSHHLKGKPDPAMFVEAARRLGVAAARTAVVEVGRRMVADL